MAEPTDMIVPMLREMRAENVELLRKLDARLDAVEGKLGVVEGKIDTPGSQQKSFMRALSADSLMSRLITGEFEERIETLERKVKELEPHK